MKRLILASCAWLAFAAPALAQAPDTSPHRVHRITVEEGVTLEVLDWGGTGRPLVFIPGNGNDAHVFDTLALKFTAKHHVYAITRRGVGKSSAPDPTPENYDSDRRGDDVLAVMEALKIENPVLAGHSLGGSELSSIGTRRPDRVAGLIYLDAGHGYAFHFPAPESSLEEINDLRRMLAEFVTLQPSQIASAARDIRASMKIVDGSLRWFEEYGAMAQDDPEPQSPEQQKRENAIWQGTRKYSGIKPPILSIYAVTNPCNDDCDAPLRRWQTKRATAQADAVEMAYPKARVVRLQRASHRVWRSHEADVVHEMNAFMDKL